MLGYKPKKTKLRTLNLSGATVTVNSLTSLTISKTIKGKIPTEAGAVAFAQKIAKNIDKFVIDMGDCTFSPAGVETDNAMLLGLKSSKLIVHAGDLTSDIYLAPGQKWIYPLYTFNLTGAYNVTFLSGSMFYNNADVDGTYKVFISFDVELD